MAFIYSDEDMMTGGMSMGGYPLGGRSMPRMRQMYHGGAENDYTRWVHDHKDEINEAKGDKKFGTVAGELYRKQHGDKPKKAKTGKKYTKRAMRNPDEREIYRTMVKGQPYSHGPVGDQIYRGVPRLYLAERIKTLNPKDQVALAKWLDKKGAGFWDTLGHIASTAAPLLPLLF
jgi:hypothetical protein